MHIYINSIACMSVCLYACVHLCIYVHMQPAQFNLNLRRRPRALHREPRVHFNEGGSRLNFLVCIKPRAHTTNPNNRNLCICMPPPTPINNPHLSYTPIILNYIKIQIYVHIYTYIYI